MAAALYDTSDELKDNNNNENPKNSIITRSNPSSVDTSLMKCWNELKNKPVCICFDLDYTLWPMLIDKDLLPPIEKKKIADNNYAVLDHNNKRITHYDDVPRILFTLKECFSRSKSKHYLAIASKATTHDLAVQLIKMYGWYDYFSSIQIYSGIKVKHMKNISAELKLNNYKEFLFFDDSKSNITQTETLGLTAYQVGHTHGLSVKDFMAGLRKFNDNQK